MNTQGWYVQLSRASYPLEKKRRDGYRKSKQERLEATLDRKLAEYARCDRSKPYAIGRMKHLSKQIERLEYYVATGQPNSEEGNTKG